MDQNNQVSNIHWLTNIQDTLSQICEVYWDGYTTALLYKDLLNCEYC